MNNFRERHPKLSFIFRILLKMVFLTVLINLLFYSFVPGRMPDYKAMFDVRRINEKIDMLYIKAKLDVTKSIDKVNK